MLQQITMQQQCVAAPGTVGYEVLSDFVQQRLLNIPCSIQDGVHKHA